MKILYFGTLDPSATGKYYAKGFEKLGHEVHYFDPNYYECSNHFEKIAQKIRHAPSAKRIEARDALLIQLCQAEQFDLIFVLTETFLSKKTLQAVRTLKSPPLFAFHSHDNVFSHGILKCSDFYETLAAYDFLFTTKSFNIDRYKQLGQPRSYFVTSAFEPSVHHPVAGDASLFGDMLPVTFIGTYDYSRDKYINAVGWERLQVWGNGWKKFKGYWKHRHSITNRAIYGAEFCDILSHSKVNLGLLREEANDLHTVRTMEIPACAGLQLAPRNEEILSLFEEDKEIVCFSSPEEMHDKINFLLRNESLRAKIAQAGYDRCFRSGYRYEDKAREMISIISEEANLPDQSFKVSATLAK